MGVGVKVKALGVDLECDAAPGQLTEYNGKNSLSNDYGGWLDFKAEIAKNTGLGISLKRTAAWSGHRLFCRCGYCF